MYPLYYEVFLNFVKIKVQDIGYAKDRHSSISRPTIKEAQKNE
jgi:hypothetical protein